MAMKELKLSFGEHFYLPFAEWIGLYGVPTAAKLLDVDRSRIYQLIDEGALEGARLLDDEGELIKVVVSKRSVKAYREYQLMRASALKPSFG